MEIPSYRVFFDTSVYIAALISRKGASGELIRLAEAGAVRMVVSEQVVVESDRVLGRKFPDLIDESRRLWKTLHPEMASDPTPQQAVPFRSQLSSGDAVILCSAQLAGVSALVTWNTRDFMKPAVEKLVSFPVVVPEDCLKQYRVWIQPYLE